MQSRRQIKRTGVTLLKKLMRHNDLGAHFTGFKFDRGITCLY